MITLDMAIDMTARAARGTSAGLRDRESLETTSKDVASCVKCAQEVVEGVNKRSSNKGGKKKSNPKKLKKFKKRKEMMERAGVDTELLQHRPKKIRGSDVVMVDPVKSMVPYAMMCLHFQKK